MGVPAAGTIIDRYRVESVIGAGSMGDVVEGVDTDLQRTVAIKILSEKHRDDQELEARFVREGRAVAAISHTNVVQVFTTGTYDGRPYIAMEFLTGSDLGSFIAKRGPMSSLHAAQAILDSARGLEAAADAGLIHRDVKPANLMMLDSGKVKVTDFGLAKPLDPTNQPALTALGVVVGTPDYIAPEQARGETIDERVDLYALGGTLYFLLTGTPPFRKGNAVDDKYLKVVARHLNDPAPNPLLVNSEIDGQLARLQLRLMSKKPKSRPSYSELIAELSEIVARLENGERSNAPDAMAVTDAAAGRTSPTPYLGSKQQAAQINVGLQDDDLDSAKTTGIPTSNSQTTSGSSSELLPPLQIRRSRVLKTLTLLSCLIFTVGIALYFFGPLPNQSQHVVADPPAFDAGVTRQLPHSIPDAAPAPLVAPEGMFIVLATDKHGAYFISKAPITYGTYSALFPTQKKPTKLAKRNRAAVTNVSFANAASFARTQGAQLPTKAQWLEARKDKRFVSAAGIGEWLLHSHVKPKSPQGVGSSKGKITKRKPRPFKDVGFRLVIDPSVANGK